MSTFEDIKKIQDDRRRLLLKADVFASQGKYSDELIKMYLSAAQMSARLASMTTGAETERQLKFQRTYEEKAMEIRNEMVAITLEKKRATEQPVNSVAVQSDDALKVPPVRSKNVSVAEALARRTYEGIQPSQTGSPISDFKKVSVDSSYNQVEGKSYAGSSSVNDGNNVQSVAWDRYGDWFVKAPKGSMQDVVGMNEIHRFFHEYLANEQLPQTQQLLNIDATQSVLLYGLPGCGKTFVVDSFAGDLASQRGYKYLKIKAKDVLRKHAGEAEKVIAEIYDAAIENAPCLLFIDEIDGLCKRRELAGETQWIASVTSAFLTGFNDLQDTMRNSGKKVLFVGATNYPEQVDAAMVDRMRPVRIPNPGRDVVVGYLKNEFKKMHIVCAVGDSVLAETTLNFNFRDLNRVLDCIKRNIMVVLRNTFASDEAAGEAIQKGMVSVDEIMFKNAVNEAHILSKTMDEEKLSSWEKAVGIWSEKVSYLDEGQDISGIVLQSREQRIEESSVVEEAVQSDWTVQKNFLRGENVDFFFEGNTDGINPEVLCFNPWPQVDIEAAYYFNGMNAEMLGETYQEAATHYYRLMDEYKLCISETEDADSAMKIRYFSTLKRLQKIVEGGPERSFRGFNGSNFDNSYDRMNTVLQGRAIEGFGGTCGICSSASIVNQQLGTLISEADAIEEFVKNEWCECDQYFLRNGKFADSLTETQIKTLIASNGGTSLKNRMAYFSAHELRHDYEMTCYPDEMGSITLEKLAQHFNAGQSIVMAVHARDIGCRMESPLNRLLNSSCMKQANHAIIVAGFSYDSKGNILGVWVNDTGGFGSFYADGKFHFNNRIYLDRTKFMEMSKSTYGFSVEYVWK